MNDQTSDTRPSAEGKVLGIGVYGITKIDDTSEGFIVSFMHHGMVSTVNFGVRHLEFEQMSYAHGCVKQWLVTNYQ